MRVSVEAATVTRKPYYNKERSRWTVPFVEVGSGSQFTLNMSGDVDAGKLVPGEKYAIEVEGTLQAWGRDGSRFADISIDVERVSLRMVSGNGAAAPAAK